MKNLNFTLIVLLLISACVSPQKILDRGKPDRALKISLNRLKKGKVKTEHISVFEQSFIQVTEKDHFIIDTWKSSGESSVWPLIYDHGLKVAARQQKVNLVYSRLVNMGYQPQIDFYPVNALLEEARDKSALYFYARASECLFQARNGNRHRARQAYHLLEKSLFYRNNFKDAPELMEEMYSLGTTHIVLNPQYGFIPNHIAGELYEQLLGRSQFPQRNNWQVLHLEDAGNEQAHFQLDFYFDNIDVSGDSESVDHCSATKEIVDQVITKEVWSEADSAYIEVKEIILKTVSGTVTTYEQMKTSEINLYSMLHNLTAPELSANFIYRGSECWTNTYSTICGDSRATDGVCRDHGGWCSSFPSDKEMIKDAAADVTHRFWKQLRMPVD